MEVKKTNVFSGKTAVITGGGGVLCSELASVLASNGANVALLNRNIEKTVKIAEDINLAGGKAIAISADVLDKSSLVKAKDEINKIFGKCDILINGAGGNNPKGTTNKEYYEMGDEEREDIISFFNLDPESIKNVIDLNFTGTLIPSQVFAKDMLSSEGCTIINISSMNAFRPLTKIPAYSAAKSAVSNLTMWMAIHFAKAGIRVNAIAPGFFVTKQNYSLLYDENNNLSARAKKIIDHTPMGRFGKPSDLSGTLLWLADENASGFVTGVIIPVDGGFSTYSGV